MANQKRQWYQIQSQAKDHKQHKEPTSLFEHFFIVGLSSYANVEAVEDAFARRKTWESEVAKSEILDLRKIQRQARMPTLEPQILFKYPPGKQVAMRESDVPIFCFPEGVKARMLERTPSMSDLNELVFGQEHLAHDDSSFVFRLKVADSTTLYGVCLHVQEIVQRAPGILGAISPLNPSCKSGRFLVSAPRCYCMLTKVPFFELHFEMLNSITAQERLDRITQFVSEMALTESIPFVGTEQDQLDENFESPNGQFCNSWMGYAIPAGSILGLTSPSIGLPSDREVPPFLFRQLEPHSPESAASECSDFSHVRELDRESRKSWGHFDDHSSVTSGSRSDSFDRTNGSLDTGQTSPENSTTYSCVNCGLLHVESIVSVYSSVRGTGSEEEDDDLCYKHDIAGDEKVMEWAKLHNNEPLQIVCGYHTLPVPPRGREIIFHPLEHLQPIKYFRPNITSLGLDNVSQIDISFPTEVNEVNARLAAAEEGLALSIWTVATVCRVLSLESVLTLIAGALLEKQVVVICPNLGVLSAIVLSVIPIIRPFEWQSLFLPVLPRRLFDFLDAPVPFIVGIQNKPTEMKKTPNLIQVNVYKDQVKACPLPQLPRHKELVSQLGPIHARLSCENFIAKRHPIYKCSEIQAEAAGDFLNVMKHYLESLCSNLRSHTITNVQSNNDKVSLLLKDSFVGSFPVSDRPFIKLLVETQQFSVLSDSQLSTYENEPF
ncbi:uncharacterized protein A4U43_C10F18570 [Asparagus officinalis]|uniref:UDENN domain-containing protein n=1 Tax=Asparagus officinalis TaxID=4686 RepID=A0A5P1E3R4_ASPOF|nr:uncharacterized protein LOC109824961 [Asparagus officinalis]ONK57292.1 uncharacterized protein A4U43_C10F18570 [Asparagus officinalis]